MAGTIDHVAIVGGGFSGTLQAINLLRHGGPRATLIERRPMAGEGLAYGAASPGHVLNVRASNMSALPDDPGHFVRWLEARGVVDAASAFVPRPTYGIYLRELLGDAVAGARGRLEIVHGDAVDIAPGRCVSVGLAGGRRIEADAAVLAVGNLPPHDPAGLDDSRLSAGRYRADPWDPEIAEGLADADTVLIVGTGLTMVDMALLLESRGFGGRIVALSRRGLLPRVHSGPGGDWRRINERPASTASQLVRGVRDRARSIGWRQAVDELRPFTQDMWRAASDGERGRFIRHLRPWWDVHRHRLAPEVAARIEAMRRDGRLEIVAGKPVAFAETGKGVEMIWRPRGAQATRRLEAARVINCTGPQGDLLRTRDPLLRRLVERGAIRPDSARLGIDVDPQARTIAADGRPNDWLYALGPMTRGAFWEIVAVPDIRAQTWSLARRLSNAQWVGGEGL
jgi:uncharacterized NAD(P)/FAD-binding protein YdhS